MIVLVPALAGALMVAGVIALVVGLTPSEVVQRPPRKRRLKPLPRQTQGLLAVGAIAGLIAAYGSSETARVNPMIPALEAEYAEPLGCPRMPVPDAVLTKPGRLTPEEYEVVKAHSSDGARIDSASAMSRIDVP